MDTFRERVHILARGKEIQVHTTVDLTTIRLGFAPERLHQLFNPKNLSSELERLRGVESVYMGRYSLGIVVGHLFDEFEVLDAVERLIGELMVLPLENQGIEFDLDLALGESS